MTNARSRRDALRQLLVAGQAGTQGELSDALAQAGHAATQSTISRDLKLLGAQRTLRHDGLLAYHLPHDRPTPLPGDMIVSIDHNETMVVVRTRVGRAPAVALDLDALEHAQILGTLAGDDAVLVVPRSTSRTGQLAAELRSIAGLE